MELDDDVPALGSITPNSASDNKFLNSLHEQFLAGVNYILK